MNVSAAEFKRTCLKLIDEVRDLHMDIVITKAGKPIAKLVPMQHESSHSAFGHLKGTVIQAGDLIAPTGERWDAD